jgi:soluble lytic murein transglycosylase-like protein
MSSKSAITGAALAVFLLTVPMTASAQIYTWRDSSGTLVLSATRPADDNGIPVQTYAVPGPVADTKFRSTQPVQNHRSAAFESLIEEHSARHGVSADLVRAVIQAESAFDPLARSPKGAMGLMQLMPATAAELGVQNPYDADENISGGVAYLKSLLVRYDGNEELALAAYNAGPAAVEKYGAVPPYKETRNYVAKIIGTAGAVAPPPARVYETIEMVNGRAVIRYSSKPSPGASVVPPASIR